MAYTLFVLHETWQTSLFSIYYCVKLRVKFRFYVFLSFFGIFAHIVAQTWFVLHETSQTILFSIYYCVEVVRIENHSHMPQITC